MSVKTSQAQAPRVDEPAKLRRVSALAELVHLGIYRMLVFDVVAISRKAGSFVLVDEGSVTGWGERWVLAAGLHGSGR